MKKLLKFLPAIALILWANFAIATGPTGSGVQQSGNVTAGHGAVWVSKLLLGDAGFVYAPYPAAGIPNSTGSAWGTPYTISGTGSVLAAVNSPTFLGTVTLPAGQVVNGVTLNGAGSATSFLNASGTYTSPIGAVSSVFTRTGAVTAQSGDYTTALVTESGNLYFTQARAIASPITGFSAGAGIVSATDTILGAFNKIVGNINALTTGVSSVFGRSGAVTAQSGDYTTAQVTESGNLYFTNARGIASTLTGYVSGAGTISASDSILAAIQKLNGNIVALVTGVSSFNSRVGAVTPTSGDYTVGQVTGAAPLASPAFTGTPTVPTATVGTSTTQAASTAFVAGVTSLPSLNIAASQVTSGTLSASLLPAFTGDITTSAGSSATTLATVNANVGSFGDATHTLSLTLNGKGLTTAASTNLITPAGIGAPTTTGTGASGTWGINVSGNAATVTTNANLTGDVTSVGNATSIGSSTITGKQITGFVAGAGTVSATDTILTAFNKIVGNITALTTGVSSVFGRSGAVTAQSGDYTTAQVTESGNLYFTNARAIASTLTGYVSGAGTVSATDSILVAIQKLNGNISALVTGVSSFNSRVGAVVPALNDYNFNQLAGTASLTTQASGTLQAAQFPALTGDLTTTAGALATTLATVNTNTGSFGSSTAIPTFTVNGKGLITAASTAVVIAPAGTLSGATLNSSVTASSLTSVGTLGSLTMGGNITISAHNIVTDTSTGTDFGTGTTQKIGFYGLTPIVQPTGDALTALQNLGLVASATLTPADAGLGTSSTPQFLRLGLNQAADATASLAMTQTAIGTSSTNGIILQNTTAATSTVPQWSPRFHLEGQGWKTNATAGSQAVDFIEEVQPTITGTASATGSIVWSSSVAGGSYGALLTLPIGGGLNLNSGTYQIGGTQIACANLSNAGVFCNGTSAASLTGTLAAAQLPAFTGDITTSAGSAATTLATVNTNTGAFGSSTAIPVITLNGKGLATAASTAVVIAPAGTLSGATLNSSVTASSLTSVGTLSSLTLGGDLTLSTHNLITDTTTGTKIGTATSQKLGFFNATPIVQPSGNILTAMSNLGFGTLTIQASDISTGTIATARLGSGSATSTTALFGDQTYKTIQNQSTTAPTTCGGFSGGVCPTASGSAPYTTPAGVAWIEVFGVGGGGGGGGTGISAGGTAGGNGGNTTFGTSLFTANAGSGGCASAGSSTGGAGGTATGGFLNVTGGDGGATSNNAANSTGGAGGSNPLGGGGPGGTITNVGNAAKANTGGGGGGAGGNTTTVIAACGGGAGGYFAGIITSPAGSYSANVGAAGAAGSSGTSGFAGSLGAVGRVWTIEHYDN